MSHRTLRERFEAKYEACPDGCWIWHAVKTRNGYGSFYVGPPRTTAPAHRVSYELYVGEIPTGLTLDHLCRNRACVNPAHLEPVTHAENMRRSGPATKPACVNGHAYDERNTYLRPSGQRDCRACIRERQRRARRKQAA